MRIHFEDQGQDFLRWDVDANGTVTDSWPFQASLWRGCRVLRHTELKIGDCVIFRSADGKRTSNVRYPIALIECTPEASPHDSH